MNYYSSWPGLPATEIPAIDIDDPPQTLSKTQKSKRRAAVRAADRIAAVSEVEQLERSVEGVNESDNDKPARKRGRVKRGAAKAAKTTNPFLAFSYNARCDKLTALHNAFLDNEKKLDKLESLVVEVRNLFSSPAQDMDVER